MELLRNIDTMIRDHVDAERKLDPRALRTVRPSEGNPRLRYHPYLTFRAALRWERSEFRHMPTLDEITAVDPVWENEVAIMHEWLKFHRDYYRRPQWLQNLIRHVVGENTSILGESHEEP